MKTTIDNRVWSVLKEEEQQALMLSHHFGKSSWENGEILGKAHYKYLEIKQRADKFLHMFTEFFEENGSGIPVELDKPFNNYINNIIYKRKTKKEAVVELTKFNPRFKKVNIRTIYFREELIKLKDHNTEQGKALYQLILEFDRWNNFRIIPSEFQLPSAFKRREKNALKKKLQQILKMNKVVVRVLTRDYGVRTTHRKHVYCPLFWDEGKENKIALISWKEDAQEYINNLGLYVFSTKREAQDYIDIVQSYKMNELKTCKQGQKFWPKYREIIAKATNKIDDSNLDYSIS